MTTTWQMADLITCRQIARQQSTQLNLHATEEPVAVSESILWRPQKMYCKNWKTSMKHWLYDKRVQEEPWQNMFPEGNSLAAYQNAVLLTNCGRSMSSKRSGYTDNRTQKQAPLNHLHSFSIRQLFVHSLIHTRNGGWGGGRRWVTVAWQSQDHHFTI